MEIYEEGGMGAMVEHVIAPTAADAKLIAEVRRNLVESFSGAAGNPAKKVGRVTDIRCTGECG